MKHLFSKPIVWFLVMLAIIAAGIAIYRQFYLSTPEVQYRTQAVEIGDIRQTVSANGTINPVTLVNVGTQVSGTVKKLYVDFNSKVEKGQILLELDDALLAAQQKQSLANAQSAAASLELATANETRMRSLFTQNYVSQQELDTAVQAKKVAEAQLQLARASMERDRVNLAYTVIRSPVSGVVVDRSVDVGQTVAASLQTPTLFKIAQDLSKMQIDAYFAEADIGNIRVGQPARFTVDAFENRNFKGEVKLIRLNPSAQQNVVTYDVVVNVDNPEQILLPGMTAYVSITVAERKEALLVSNAALRFKPATAAGKKPAASEAPDSHAAKPENGKKLSGQPRDTFSSKVYVLKNGAPAPVSVSLGITDNRNTEITGGELKAGDQVIVSEIQPGSKSKTGGAPPMRMF